MKKKSMAVVPAVLMVIVVVVAAIVTYRSIASEESPSALFMDMINKYRYSAELKGVDKIREQVDDILEAESIDDCEGRAANAIDALAAEGLKQPKEATYVHTVITRMKAEAEANMHFCRGKILFDNAEFDGVNEKFLEPATKEFQLAIKKGRSEFKAVKLSEQYLLYKISTILSCHDTVCYVSKDTKKYCVSFSIGKKDYCKKAFPLDNVGSIFSQQELKIYCDAVMEQTGFAYTSLDEKTGYLGCYNCRPRAPDFFEVKSCDQYGYNEKACVGDICNIGPCEFPEQIGSDGKVTYGPCRPAGTGVMCNDHRNKEECEGDYLNKCLWVAGPNYHPYPEYREYGKHFRCIDCADIETCEDYGVLDTRFLSESSKAFDFCNEDSCFQKYGNSLGRSLLTCKSNPGTDVYRCVSKGEACSNFHNNKEQCLSKDYCYFVPGPLSGGEFSVANAGPGAGECKDCSELKSCSELLKAGDCSTCKEHTSLKCAQIETSDIDSTPLCVSCSDGRICNYASSMASCYYQGADVGYVCGIEISSDEPPVFTDFPEVGEGGGVW